MITFRPTGGKPGRRPGRQQAAPGASMGDGARRDGTRATGGGVRVFVTGGTGLVGRHLIGALAARGDRAVCLTRDREGAAAVLPPGVEVVEGDPRGEGPWQSAVAGCDAAVNLAGESIFALRWTPRKKRRIRRSRLAATRNLVEAVHGADALQVLVSASATGYYADGGDRALGEDSEPGGDFLARVTREWEGTALQAERGSTRVVLARLGIVMAADGGALPVMRRPFRLGLGGRLGSGRQYFPWIHVEDLVRALLFCLDTPALRGPANVVAPDPPTQADFAAALAAALDRSAALNAPAWLVRLAMGEQARMVLKSLRVVPRALRARGFAFEHAELDAALRDLVR